mmetsp:Transcript_66780/g.159765  ORF Transcript_66780/g.159765 Transcript_66780/m.159765 type:complete len:1049 (-) Transcript_66780:193-3339(-)
MAYDESLLSTIGCQVLSFIIAARTELILFVGACLVHHILFGRRSLGARNIKSLKVKEANYETDTPTSRRTSTAGTSSVELEEVAKQKPGLVLERSQEAFEQGDYRGVLRCWGILKKHGVVPAQHLGNIVEAMQRFKKDSAAILAEVKPYLIEHERCHCVDYINDFLQTMMPSMDNVVVGEVADLLPKLGCAPTSRTFDIILAMHFSTRNFDEVEEAAARMKRAKITPSQRANLVLLKTALRTSKLQNALEHFAAIASAKSVSPPPAHVTAQLVEMACREQETSKVLDVLEKFAAAQVPVDAVNGLLTEGQRLGDFGLINRVLDLARSRGTALNARSYQLLIKSYKGKSAKILSLLGNMESEGVEWSSPIGAAILSVCDMDLAKKLCELLKSPSSTSQTAHILTAVIRFYSENGCPDQACAVYEEHARALPPDSRPVLDVRTERLLTRAAVESGCQDLASCMVSSGSPDAGRHVAMIRTCVAKGSLEGAFSIFESLEKGGKDLSQTIYNTVLDACVEIGNTQDVESWLKRMKADQMLDVVTYNTLIKAYMKWGMYDKASALVKEMRAQGHSPNHVTYNELIHAFVKSENSRWQNQVWQLIGEMKAEGVQPTRITCSILLKNLGPHSSERDIMRTMDLIGSMKENMDEVLLSSVIEACVRIGKPDMVMQQLESLHASGRVSVNGPHTFGSLIKAYGHTKDIAGAWRCWREMRSRHVKPTSITIGCMVEAVASNGDVDGAHELVQQLMEDELCREQVNAVIYCSVLKGYSRSRKMERVWAVWKEMLSHGISPSVVTFNAMIDACARNSNMEAVPGLLSDMKARGLAPNVITYSTMLKGCCMCGDLRGAFGVLDDMKSSTRLRPDEIMYNTLLDGCAQSGLVAEGERVLEQMQAEGVSPSSYTLTVIAKLMGNARRVDRAFVLIQELTTKYRFKANAHVHAALIQACLTCRDVSRAEKVLEQMVSERMQVEPRTWQGIVRGAIAAGNYEQAANIMALALGAGHRASSQRVCKMSDDAFVKDILSNLAEKGEHIAELVRPLQAVSGRPYGRGR